MGLVKHMRLTKDFTVKDNNNGNGKYGYGTGVYELYRGSKDGQPQYQSVFVNLVANSEREVNFLEKFGKKGTILNISGEVSPGKPYEKDGEWVSTINVNVENAKFSDVRISNNQDQAAGDKKAPAKNQPKADKQKEDMQEVEDIFEFWEKDEEETA